MDEINKPRAADLLRDNYLGNELFIMWSRIARNKLPYVVRKFSELYTGFESDANTDARIGKVNGLVDMCNNLTSQPLDAEKLELLKAVTLDIADICAGATGHAHWKKYLASVLASSPKSYRNL